MKSYNEHILESKYWDDWQEKENDVTKYFEYYDKVFSDIVGNYNIRFDFLLDPKKLWYYKDDRDILFYILRKQVFISEWLWKTFSYKTIHFNDIVRFLKILDHFMETQFGIIGYDMIKND